MGTCCSVPSVEEAESAQQFRALDANKDNLACREEMAQYVASRAELWAMLSINLGLSEAECRETATRVAMELASGKQGRAAQASELTEAEFHTFRAKYILNGKGAQEFFHRCVFATFDADGNDALDPDEVDQFLDTFYKSGSIFEGDSRLPPRETLKQQMLKNASADGTLRFHQIRSVIQGTMGGGGGSAIVADQQLPAASVPAISPEAAPKEPEQTPEPVRVPPSPASSKKGSSVDPEETPEVRPKAKKNLNTSTHSHTSHTDDSPHSKPRKRRKPKAKTPAEQLQDDSNKSSASEKQKTRKPRAKKPSPSSSSDPRAAQYDTDDAGNMGKNGEGKPRPRRKKKIRRNNSNLSQASSGLPSAGSDCENINNGNNNGQASRPPRSQRKKKIRRNTSDLSQDSASSPAQPSGGSDYDDSNGQTIKPARSQRKKSIRRSNSNLSQDSGHGDKPRKPRPRKRQEGGANQGQ